ncbi:hypothetical protein, conserved [Trypanosoma brucei brucei TREU927]|uniref:Protein phosphatase inhibitor 2 (IPP-2) n=1 Tax=Trypanosoma brucei brucei (strain 927/4 GUTat10.1) TaxID=185431 RepID=Q580S8_TRYB2|nr:hypothetical protein, conserved [Trypanosoma brucei brucei TREU927]AAX81056.1 hypothetical protein, conserved [Trypanosoma brucei]AAZ10578.1 hypothetical protein, conserved [Trypanosoma brucei brucei TREU927]
MTGRKRVMWDEKNLEDNEEYRRTHPVTMHITEPKTPFQYPEDEEDFEEALERNDDGGGDEVENGGTWDPKVNELARQVREEFRKEAPVVVAPVAPSGRPMLSDEVVSGEALEKQRAAEFKTMRKAVYADEGARVKALLGKGNTFDDDGDDGDDNNEEEEGEEGKKAEDSNGIGEK